ncbi:putative metallo-beta-lactamase domain protein [Blakeslea trispora]|nr:putative metallo-beta-lactamase domain protein [Blakeslea trispora]
MTTALIQLPNFAQLSQRVWRVMGLNPGKFTLQGTNTYLLGTGAKKILLDCGEGNPDYIPLLKASLEQTHPDAFISDIIISHGHADHWGGLEGILNTWHHPIKIHKHMGPGPSDHLAKFPSYISVQPLVDNQEFWIDKETSLKVIFTPGHCGDHCTFWLEQENSLFTADCVLGQGTAVFEDLSEYLKSLERLVKLKPGCLYPGHGPVIEEGQAKINEYIHHRLEREKQIVELMKTESWTAMAIVKILYKDYPESLYLPAAKGIVLHLKKLQKEGRVIALNKDKDEIYQLRWALVDKERKNNL